MKSIFLTVDVECHNIDLVNNYIYGNIGEEKYGIEKIIEIADKNNIIVNFFVDVVEAFIYGDKYVENIVNIINSSGHKVCFHLHPNYVSKNDDKSYFWQYTKEEKKEIFKTSLEKFLQFSPNQDKIIFRMGRYGVDKEFYQIAKEMNIKLVDLSYRYSDNKMCKLTYDDVKTKNNPTKYYEHILIPNTRYIAFKFFKKVKLLGVDVSETNFTEFCDIIKNIKSDVVVLTMHSWDLFFKFFWTDKIYPNNINLKKFDKMIKYAKSNGYSFFDLSDYKFVENEDKLDEAYDPFIKNKLNYIKYFIYNIIRFLFIGFKNKKYFYLYIFALLFLIIIAILLGGLLF